MYLADGVTARGHAAILHRLQANAELREAYGHGAHEVDAIDPQTLDVRIITLAPAAKPPTHWLSARIRLGSAARLHACYSLASFQEDAEWIPPMVLQAGMQGRAWVDQHAKSFSHARVIKTAY